MASFRRAPRLAFLLGAAAAVAAVSLGAQTSAGKMSAAGTWKMDPPAASEGQQPASVTLTILSDTPELLSWRVGEVDADQAAMSYSWSGPKDGSPHPMKDKDGNTIGQQSARMDGDALVRQGDVPDGSFESRATMSADGRTMTDEIVARGKDGTVNRTTVVYPASRRGRSRTDGSTPV